MSNKKLKCAMAVAAAGTVLHLGCIGGLQQYIIPAAIYAGLEFVTDSDGVFDLFEDGDIPVAAAE